MGYRTTKSKIKAGSNKASNYTDFFYHAFRNIIFVSIPLTLISALALSLPHSSATISNSEADTITLNLSTSCTISSTLINEHTINLNGGQYGADIGNTKVNAYCNDNNGYNIYAIGYSGNVDGNTDLISNISNDFNINTGTYSSGNTSSSWGMKLTAGSGTGIDPTTGESVNITPPTIVNGYNNYNIVPSVYTLVAKRESGTSMTTDTTASGSYFNTTYDIYASSVQPAGTYVGKVKYLMTHPNTNAPSTINDIDAAFAAAGKQKVYQDENGSYYAMQDMTSDICNLVTTRTGETTSSQLVDIRDDKLYWVTKEKDNHCWMTQNLDLDINGLNTSPLNSNNTDISSDPAISGAGIYGNAGGYTVDNGIYTWNPETTTANITVDFTANTATGWDNQNSLPRSAEGGDVYYYPPDSTGAETRYDTLEDCTYAHPTASDCEHYHVGNYYNYTTTVASNNSNVAAFNVQYTNADNSICPKNWRLPIATNDGSSTMEFGQLLFNSGITTGISSSSYANNGFKNVRKAPLWFVRSGYLSYGTLLNPASNGRYWSSTVISSSNAYYLYFNGNAAYPTNSGGRGDGRSVRCIAR